MLCQAAVYRHYATVVKQVRGAELCIPLLQKHTDKVEQVLSSFRQKVTCRQRDATSSFNTMVCNWTMLFYMTFVLQKWHV